MDKKYLSNYSCLISAQAEKVKKELAVLKV